MRTMVSGAAVFLLLSAVSWCRGIELGPVVTGSNVTFTANVVGQPSEMTWLVTYSETNISKIVDLEEGRPTEVFRSFKNRVNADLREKTLILYNVTPADSRLYTARSFVNDRLSEIDFNLKVYDHVCTVRIQNTTVENNVTLRCVCFTSGPSPSQYKWYNGTKTVSELQNITVSKEEKSQNFMCVASNVVSSSKANFTVDARTPDKTTLSTAAIVFIVIGIVIIIIAVVGFILYKKGLLFSICRSKTETEKTAENGEGAMLIETKHLADPSGSNDEERQNLKPAGDSSGSSDEERENIKPAGDPSGSNKEIEHLKPAGDPSGSNDEETQNLKPAGDPSGCHDEERQNLKPAGAS